MVKKSIHVLLLVAVVVAACSGLQSACEVATRNLAEATSLVERLVEAEREASNGVEDLCVVAPVPECEEAREFLADVRYRLAQAQAAMSVAQIAYDRVCGVPQIEERVLTKEESAYVRDLRSLRAWVKEEVRQTDKLLGSR